MAANLTKAADDARRLLRGFKAFAEVAEALEAVGQLEQRQAEAEKVLVDLAPKIDAERAELQRLAAQCEALVVTARGEADTIKAEAKAAALATVESASRAAAEIAADADALRATAESAACAALAAAGAELAKRDALEAECVEIEKRADKARAFIAKLKD